MCAICAHMEVIVRGGRGSLGNSVISGLDDLKRSRDILTSLKAGQKNETPS